MYLYIHSCNTSTLHEQLCQLSYTEYNFKNKACITDTRSIIAEFVSHAIEFNINITLKPTFFSSIVVFSPPPISSFSFQFFFLSFYSLCSCASSSFPCFLYLYRSFTFASYSSSSSVSPIRPLFFFHSPLLLILHSIPPSLHLLLLLPSYSSMNNRVNGFFSPSIHHAITQPRGWWRHLS